MHRFLFVLCNRVTSVGHPFPFMVTISLGPLRNSRGRRLRAFGQLPLTTKEREAALRRLAGKRSTVGLDLDDSRPEMQVAQRLATDHPAAAQAGAVAQQQQHSTSASPPPSIAPCDDDLDDVSSMTTASVNGDAE